MFSRIDKDVLPIPYKVVQKYQETKDTFTIEILPKNHSIENFAPGQFNMLYLFGTGDVPISISAGTPDKITHTIRAVGTVTNRLAQLKKGDTIGVSGPFGNAWPISSCNGEDIVIIVGGIGLAPLRPVIYHILNNRSSFQKVILLYGVRTPQDVLFVTELDTWRKSIDVETTVDVADSNWNGHVGVVTSLMPLASFTPEKTTAMICGPEIMMKFSIISLLQRKVPKHKIFISMERNMKCAVGLCGHCQWGASFICKDGAIFDYANIESWWEKRKI